MVLGSDGMANLDNTILGMGQLKDTTERFFFKVMSGVASGANVTECSTEIAFVQLGDEATLPPGVARDHNHGELDSDYTRH
jgi:hypothetical protein